MSFDHIIQNRFVSHLLFWASFLIIFTILATLNGGPLHHHLFNYFSLLTPQIMAAYTLVYYQYPQLFLKKKYLLFSLSFLISAYLFSILSRIIVIYFVEPIIRENFEQESIIEILTNPLYLFSIYFPAVYLTAFVMLVVKLIKESFEEKHRLEVLQKEKVASELKFLKAQINPHFLFNTLNNLYALTLAKSDVAPKVVVKLSELLDYILYDCSEPKILLKKEVELIRNYIDLELLRYNEQQVEVIFNYTIEKEGSQIPPMILLSFIENAFKHGLTTHPRDAKVHIELIVIDKVLSFSVFNTKPINPAIPEMQKNRSGIGANNIKRQLDINYPNKYELKIEDLEKEFKIFLRIDLK